MFKRLIEYPVNCINWHDRWTNPSMAEARKLTEKCFLGGINERRFKDELRGVSLEEHLKEAITSAGARGLMLGPGCVAQLPVPEENFAVAREAVNKLSKLYL